MNGWGTIKAGNGQTQRRRDAERRRGKGLMPRFLSSLPGLCLVWLTVYPALVPFIPPPSAVRPIKGPVHPKQMATDKRGGKLESEPNFPCKKDT
jgi:hypothetical protein